MTQAYKISQIDEGRDLFAAQSREQALDFAVDHLIEIGQAAVAERGLFTVALSGGSTPKAIFERLAEEKNRKRIDWSKALIFWSDERSVPPDDADSNFRQAMDAGIGKLGLSDSQIFRAVAEGDIAQGASDYERAIADNVPDARFDLIMLGMGSDGHTASLFPRTQALDETERLVVANEVPQLNTWRMTFTYPLIDRAHNVVIYVLGADKSKTVEAVLYGKRQASLYPVQKVGKADHRALWVLWPAPAR